MARYVAGGSVLRLDGRRDQPIQPGEAFEYDFSPEQENVLLLAGAIVKREAPPASPAAAASPAGLTGAVDKE